MIRVLYVMLKMKSPIKTTILSFALSLSLISADENSVSWEYKVETMVTAQRIINKSDRNISHSSTFHLGSKLSKLGLQRWELVSVVPIAGEQNKAIYYFKRPIIHTIVGVRKKQEHKVIGVRKKQEVSPVLQRQTSTIKKVTPREISPTKHNTSRSPQNLKPSK